MDSNAPLDDIAPRGPENGGDSLPEGLSDTTPEADAMQCEVYRRLGGVARVAIAFRLTAFVRDTTMAGIRHRHPEYDALQVHLAYARLTLGEALVREVYPGREFVEP